MAKPLSLLSIKQSHLSLLKKAGYDTVGDLKFSTVDSLTSELKVSHEEASQIFQALDMTPAGPQNTSLFPVSQSASSLLSSARIHTSGISSVDQLVDDGLRKAQCLEIAGPPGSGKELLALEFIRNALKEDTEVLIIDCQNAMPPSFLRETLGQEGSESVHHVTANGYAELFAVLNQLPTYLAACPSISLVVFASLSIALQLCPNHSIKLRLLTLLKTTLMRMGARNGLSFIVTMHLSTKMQNQDGTTATFETGAKAIMVPAFGDDWYPVQKTFRFLLYRERSGQRSLSLVASPSPVRTGIDTSLNFGIEEGRIAVFSP